ncbi:MAG: DNA polymerase III subunit alpha, partial [Planctomycetales bacterium]|nr:DNA polymerase III subunit alpha [Planctomycetales bacterium]
MSRSFVHLHCHSHYSLLDGAGPIEGLVDKAKKSGMNALAITDHGNLYGALEFYQKATAAGIKPIVGYEAYIAPGSRFIKEAPTGDQEASYHLTLLAKNRTGFKNLIKMASHAYLEGFYRKPRIDKDLLKDHSEGIICLSGCVSGELSRTLLRGGAEPDWDNARRIAEWFQSIFGDRYYLEIQNNHLEIQRLALEGTVEIAKRTGIPLVATSDAHYVNREDAEAQDVLLCINTGRFRTDTNRMKMEGSEFFLRSPDEMYQAFPGLEDAVGRSQEIADTVDINLELGKRYFPTLPIPPERTPPDFLHELCVAGLKERYENEPGMLTPEGELAPQVVERLDRELSCINKLGFANYFLVVWDFVRYAVENNIPCSARGSGVGSIVAYALKLSHVCPLKYDLLFERFLDENRKEAPDIDIDFCKDRRGDVINYVKQKYGKDNVAQIGTFGTLAARAAIRD